MEINTFFLGVIALCMIVLTLSIMIFMFGVLKALNSTNEKLAIITFELSQILPSLRKSAKNLEGFTSLFGILNLFTSKSNKE